MDSSSSVMSRLRQFDAYPKTLEDFRVKTFSGAAVTLVSGILMLTLFLSELNFYLTTEVQPELFVDVMREKKLKINVDVTFPKVACSFLTIDAMDVSGEQQIDVAANLFKTRLDINGKQVTDEPPAVQTVGSDKKETNDPLEKPLDPNRCESCYGAENAVMKCCNTCADVREAYRKKGWAFTSPESIIQCSREGYAEKIQLEKKEGCRLYGYLLVNKVAGNFHFAPGKSFQQSHVHVHDLQSLAGVKFNMSHTIYKLSFGEEYPGLVNPLESDVIVSEEESLMYQYFVKIVPTTYVKANGNTVYTNQYSVTKHKKKVTTTFGGAGEHGLPGVFVQYELSPMMVKYTEKRRSFLHFLTGVCAIIGGVFTVAGLIDSFIYHSSRAIQKKIELGKAN
ncbi:endoplasmic reticulum-Golgi intermediate compartment protein 3-like [Tubulanus polymorphus]|uniref:endoplasmic reticulum-Golgi intermediate compartment protein 3-like n=1 Tax=Tubulanus polymorphus TaxID=672921 RepID=UPI003DA1DF47